MCFSIYLGNTPAVTRVVLTSPTCVCVLVLSWCNVKDYKAPTPNWNPSAQNKTVGSTKMCRIKRIKPNLITEGISKYTTSLHSTSLLLLWTYTNAYTLSQCVWCAHGLPLHWCNGNIKGISINFVKVARKTSPTLLHIPTAYSLSHARWEAYRSNRLFIIWRTRHSARHPHQEDEVQLWTKPPAVQHTSRWLLQQDSLQPVQSHITKLSYICIIGAQKDVTQTTKNQVTYTCK